MGCRGFLGAGRERTAVVLRGKYFASEKSVLKEP